MLALSAKKVSSLLDAGNIINIIWPLAESVWIHDESMTAPPPHTHTPWHERYDVGHRGYRLIMGQTKSGLRGDMV